MQQVVLLAAEQTAFSLVAQVAELLGARFQYCSTIHDLQQHTIDLIFWHIYPFEKEQHAQLLKLSPRVIWLVDTTYKQNRFGPSPEPQIEVTSLFFPFDPEEAYVFITNILK
jgi:hypothetical protein